MIRRQRDPLIRYCFLRSPVLPPDSEVIADNGEYDDEEYDVYDDDDVDDITDFAERIDTTNAYTIHKSLAVAQSGVPTLNQQRPYTAPKSEALLKLSSRIHLTAYDSARGTVISRNVIAAAVNSERRNDEQRIRIKDKSDRATVELVLDPRTMMILRKLINNNVVTHVYGCISTGKEANVYYAPANTGDCVIKIYKTSILVFKDRDRYVTGEHRFRRGYCKSNPRKMVKLWAEKEMRNLRRLQAANIPSPTPIALKAHVLVMTMIGSDGNAAPRLRDAYLDDDAMRRAYLQMARIMRAMYHECQLVHADLSEYNILWHNDSCYIIDVSQSVEHDHPHALEFLKKDIQNINHFFANDNAVDVMTDRALFDYVVTKRSDEEAEAWLHQQSSHKRIDDLGLATDSVFAASFIPLSLHDVADEEREFDNAKESSESVMATQLRLLTVDAHNTDGVFDSDSDDDEQDDDDDSDSFSEEFDSDEADADADTDIVAYGD